MASLFEYEKEAIRIKARRVDRGQEEQRKFSVDPNITSFEVLQSILCRAFELPPTDISISYRSPGPGGDVWLPMLSDWDLDTAILGSADHDLHLQVAVMGQGSLGEVESIVSPVAEAVARELEPVQRGLTQAGAQVSQASAGLQGLVSKSSGQAQGFFKRHANTTLPSLTSKFRAALNLDLVEQDGKTGGAPEVPPGPPVSDATFRSFLNKVGQVVAPREFRLAVYRGGLEPGLRKIAWKHLLNLYPAGLTGGERLAYLKEKSKTYTEMKSDWMSLVLQGRISDDVKTVMNMVRKDVLRTDRQHPFFAGEGNPNVTTLFNILTTYALNHQSVSYCQGMSDLASPLLVTIGEEAHTYLCFVALMQRLKPNFLLDGVAMTTKFQHLSEGLMYYDPEFYTYLKLHHADDLLFCYRWLLLEMKREFAWDSALRALEVTWASLPPATADTCLILWEERFSPVVTPTSSLELAKPCETPYGKVRALRKQTLERRSSEVEARGRVQSDTGATTKKETGKKCEKSQSLVNVRRRAINSGAKESIEEEEGRQEEKVESPPQGKRLTNLRDFYALAKDDKEGTAEKGISEKSEEAPSPCKEAEPGDSVDGPGDPFDWIGYSQANSALTVYCNRLPPPPQFGHGNPFLMFLCLACLLQHRDHIMKAQLDYQDIAMFFDKMVRAHHVDRVLGQARRLFAEYLNEDWTPSPQPNAGQAHSC